MTAGTPPDVAAARPGRTRSFSRLGRRWLREPLLHFAALGVALFAAYGYLHRGAGAALEPSRRILLTVDDLRQLDTYFEAQWHRQPTPDEFAQMVENKVQEEILYREALAIGLDKDDTIVKRRMAQKMQFLAEDVAAAHEPATDELRAWYQKNTARFALPSRVSFRHLYFATDRRGARAHDDAVSALAKLAGQPEDSPLAGSIADPFMFQSYYGDRTPDELTKEFGPPFAQAVAKLTPRAWQGPIESGYGWHLVFVDTVVPGRVPDFEEVESDVKTAWLSDQKAQAWNKAYDAMRAKYTVLLPAPPDASAAAAPAAPPRRQIPDPSGEGPQ